MTKDPFLNVIMAQSERIEALKQTLQLWLDYDELDEATLENIGFMYQNAITQTKAQLEND